MIDRRTVLGGLASLPILAACTQEGAAPPIGNGSPAAPPAASNLVRRPIPGANRQVPVIGIGTARRYADPADEAALAPLRDSIRRFSELGGEVIDTAPSYGRAEAVVGQLVEELGLRDRLFLATKVGAASKAEGAAQIEQSFRNLRTPVIDLIAVHNLRDTANQLATLRGLKEGGRVKSIGITTSNAEQYAEFERVMRAQPLDCIQIDYALDNRGAAERILPLAREKNLAVMINLPFGRGRLFQATEGKPLPDFAAEVGAATWAQFFLKYIASHPARPIPIPGMAQVRYVEDNIGAARPPLPDAAMRQRMEAFIDAL